MLFYNTLHPSDTAIEGVIKLVSDLNTLQNNQAFKLVMKLRFKSFKLADNEVQCKIVISFSVELSRHFNLLKSCHSPVKLFA